MNAGPILEEIARALTLCRLEAVLIGNAAAALHGAVVTTLDFDFLFRKNTLNMKKLRRLADMMQGRILRPYYPASDLYRLVLEDRGFQLDFMTTIHGVRSFEGLKARAARVTFGNSILLVADLNDIIRSKRAAGRPRDVAVLPILEAALDETSKKKQGARPEGSQKRK